MKARTLLGVPGAHTVSSLQTFPHCHMERSGRSDHFKDK